MALELLYSILVVFLVIFAGVMSGLTLGLMSQDVMDLKVLEQSGDPKKREYARKILPVIEHPHHTLVTLLLCNAFAVEALPIFLDRLVHEVTAILLSVTVVLVFGEIVPQALCCRYGLAIGAHSANFVLFLRLITWPISYPISFVLDWVLGSEHRALFKRPELKALVSLHLNQDGKDRKENQDGLTQNEVNAILGALDMQTKIVSNAMTPLDKVFMLSEDDILNQETINLIVRTGHSRIPVHARSSKKDILGLVLAKELLVVNVDEDRRVGDLSIRATPHLAANTPMYDVLNLFKTGRSHMAVLTKVERPQAGSHMDWNNVEQTLEREPIGIVTLEDLIEELLQTEIVDETDQFVDNLQTARVNAANMTSRLPPNVRDLLSTFRPSLSQRPSWRNLGRISSANQDANTPPSFPLLPKSSHSNSVPFETEH